MINANRRWVLAMLACVLCHAALAAAETAGRELQSSMIWAASAPAGTQAYVAFRKSFELKAQPEQPALLDIFADSRYMLWVNGEQILRGPCRFNPKRPEFDGMDVKPFLRPGKNVLTVLVHHYAGAVNGRIMQHAPGLTARLELGGKEILRTDTSWRCTPNTEYRPSPGAWSSIPDVLDGRLSPLDWTASVFDDATWEPAVTVDGNTWGALQPRSLPLPRETALTGITLPSTGQKLKDALPLELGDSAAAWNFPGGFCGRWMWSKGPAMSVYFKAVWKNAVHGDGTGCAAKVMADNSFTLFVNGREIIHNEDVTAGWTGELDLKDGDVITIDATDLEAGNRTAGLFAAFAKGGKTALGTTDFLCSTAAPDAAWRTAATLDGLEKPDQDNVHPAHVNHSGSVLLDLGRMAMSYPVMELEADEGSVVQLQYALRCRDGRPFETYGIGTTYTTRSGRQSFIAADQWCARYVTITCTSGRVRILGLKMIDRRYPFERIGSFTSSDATLTRLWDMAVNTIEATCDDAYGSDARERNEWLQDPAQPNFITTRVALSGPGSDGQKVFSDPRLLKSLLRHAALAQLPDGRLLATFPTDRGPEDCHYVIEDYACQWVEALKLYFDSTGDRAFLSEMWPPLTRQMQWFLERRTPRGLLLAREYASFDNPLAYITCEGATMNAYFYQALTDADYLGRALKQNAQADSYAKAAVELASAYNKQLWNEAEGAYNSAFLGEKILGPTAHAQLLALNRGLVPENRTVAARKWLLANYKNPGSFHCGSNPDVERMIAQKAGLNMPVTDYWLFQELFRMDSAAMDLEALGEMRRRWGPMVTHQQDAGTLSESFVDENGNGASESCHNYGAVPAYFLSSLVLGVRRDGPVWEKRLLLEPRLGDLTAAEGVVVTEHGPVPVSWKTADGGKALTFDFTLPKGVQATVRLPKLSAAPSLTLNGNVLVKQGKVRAGVRIEGRWLVVDKVTGACSGKILQ
ncbi:MAG: alpha-L-rhamnosidase C-terminal domain-containing protein [Verrucomicrobiota bacterium]